MHIEVVRRWKADTGITGTFSVDGVQKYFSLELPEMYGLLANIPKKCCIPTGTYQVQRLWSEHWHAMMPHITNVPGRSEIEIHIANFPKDIRGCMGIGCNRINDFEIGTSGQAFGEFNTDFENAIAAGEQVTISILCAYPPGASS